jgi:hypothetical protein
MRKERGGVSGRERIDGVVARGVRHSFFLIRTVHAGKRKFTEVKNS